MSDYVRYYEILGLKYNTSSEEVKKAYRNLVKLWHPDRFPNNSPEQKQAEEKFKKILEAYEVLKDYQPQVKEKNSTVVSGIYAKSDRSQTHYQEGIEYADKKLYQEAIEAFSIAIRLDPYYIEAYQYRGFIFSKLGYENRAEADLKKASELKLRKQYKEEFIYEQPIKVKNHTPTSSVSQSPWQCTRTLMGHTHSVNAIAISKDGKLFASAGRDRTIKLWQLSTEQALFTLKGHSDSIRCIAFSPDSNYLVSGSDDRTLKIWDLKTKNVRTLGSWFSGHTDEVLAVAISPDGKIIVSGSADKTLKIWDLNTGKELDTLSGYSAQISSVAISPDGKKLIGGGLEKQLRIRDLSNGKVARSLKGNSGVLAIAISSDGQLLATGGFDRNIKLWNLETGREITTLVGHLDRVSTVCFSRDGKTLISGSWDKTIKIWQIDKGQAICTLTGHSDAVLSIAIAPNGNTILSGSADNSIKIWHYTF
ncbi:MAG: DnaJ domain-containing protein [Hydrococcus sp. Prado102]|jgi:WD40 repeat protein|nr:DnaJ domain-containing protein [Hydrococcus sp. Prado102]